MFIVYHFRIQKSAKICFLFPILTLLHLEISKKKTSLIYFSLYYVHIYYSFALNVIILLVKNFKLVIRYNIVIIINLI